MAIANELCPNCEVSAALVHERRKVPLGQREVEIDLEFFRCPKCNEEFYSLDQANLRHQRAVERARLEDNLLSPAQIRSIREALSLSQRMFESVLGVGEKTCVRWEQGRVCQNVATDRLIRLIASDRENVQRLAGINGIVLPDSCFVPTPLHPDNYSRAVANWERESSESLQPKSILLGGTPETALSNTAEYEAVIIGAITDLPTQSLDAAGLKEVSKFRKPLTSLPVQ
jgi:putative zinc finger/helix-turn-helix YgiT family protein